MTNVAQYAGNQGANAANTDSRFSPFLWQNCPIREIRDGTIEGWIFEDDFLNPHPIAAGADALAGDYYGFASVGGLGALADEIAGALTLSSDGDDEGASIRTKGRPFQISRSHGNFWFEARVKSSTVADTKHGFLVGLSDALTLTATIPLTALGALGDENLVGFLRAEGDGDQLDCVYKADGVAAVTVQADAAPSALVADTYVKVGLFYNADTYVLTYYINGVAVGTKTIPSAAGTDFPNDVRLGLIFAVLNATATTPGSVTIDKWRAAQLAA
jgi:hypothetical protein